MNQLIPECPVTIGQQVSFLELAEQPDQIAHGYVVGMHWEPDHWLIDGWIVLVRCTELPLSPWIETEIDIELPAQELINQSGLDNRPRPTNTKSILAAPPLCQPPSPPPNILP